MQLNIFEEYTDFSNKKVLIGLSGGINSMALLNVLANYPDEYKPAELHLYYAHLEEHSPNTYDFVIAGMKYSNKRFKNVINRITFNSVLRYFEEQKMICHPMNSACSKDLKIIPMLKYFDSNKLNFDLVGYVREERRRWMRQLEKGVKNKIYLISWMSNEECFEIVRSEIGWYPAIYDIKDHHGKRIFTHNNCLPCKNWDSKEYEALKIYYPDYYKNAERTACKTGCYWGRHKIDPSLKCTMCES